MAGPRGRLPGAALDAVVRRAALAREAEHHLVVGLARLADQAVLVRVVADLPEVGVAGVGAVERERRGRDDAEVVQQAEPAIANAKEMLAGLQKTIAPDGTIQLNESEKTFLATNVCIPSPGVTC